jgi:multidrug transporter EmrE-like cation transporter
MLGVATVFEALGATFKKLSVGFTRPPPLLWMLGSYGCWIGLLVCVLIALIGMSWVRESATPLKLIALGVMMVSVAAYRSPEHRSIVVFHSLNRVSEVVV